MKCLNIFRVLNSTSGISCYRTLHTDGVLFARSRARNVPRKINYEPGLRRAEAAWLENSDPLEMENEADLEDSTELMNLDKEFEKAEEERRRRERLGYIITAKKFFKSPPNPVTLTCNERECIRYLHKTDPVQWNVKTLSESFPATPDAIAKVLKGKFKFSEERKRKMDLKAQKNWQLLAEGKLEAPPEVLEHMKRFINRREVLLEQIKRADFYLPEVKEEVNWNNGEMSNILVHYEKAIQKLACKKESQKQEMISDGLREPSGRVRKQMHLSASSEKSEELPLEDVEEKCSSPDGRTEMLSKDVEKKSNSSVSRTEFAFAIELKKEKVFCDVGTKTRAEDSSTAMKKSEEKSMLKNVKKKYDSPDSRTELQMKDVKEKYSSPDSSTEFAFPNEFKKLICEVTGNTDAEGSLPAMKKSKEKSVTEGPANKIDFSDPEKLRLEAEYYEKQVKDIENTAFWNKGQTSQDRALAESRKVSLGGPDSYSRGSVCSSDAYPERIKIPKDKRGSGLTFRVKDCFYDDDGKFLYRVPGMVSTILGNKYDKNVAAIRQKNGLHFLAQKT